ncbi:MAG: MscL family protein [Candidatus Roizmanbacteria bacterium]
MYSKARAEIDGFKNFVRTQNIVGLALGVIVGGAATRLVGSLVDNIINPIIGMILGSKGAFSEFTLFGTIKVGLFLNSLIYFLILLTIVYFMIHKAISLIVKEPNPKK